MTHTLEFIIKDIKQPNTIMNTFGDRYFRKKLRENCNKYKTTDIEYEGSDIEAFNCAYEELLQFRKLNIRDKILKYYRYR